jgi:hypothetical protein
VLHADECAVQRRGCRCSAGLEQEQNGSSECPGGYLNCGKRKSTDPLYAGNSLFPQVSGLCG